MVLAMPDQPDRGGTPASEPGLREYCVYLLLRVRNPLRVVVSAIFQRQDGQPLALLFAHREPDQIGPRVIPRRPS